MAEGRLEEDGTILTLLDEDGNEQAFEHLATLEDQGETYYALVPCYNKPEDVVESDGELVILKTVEENGEELLATVDDEDVLREVSAQFEDLLGDRYEIDSDDDDPDADDDGKDEDDGDDGLEP